MFKAECYLNNIRYNCERINRNKKNGLYFTKSNWINPREYGFDIEGEDPRLFILNNKVYAIFICLSPYYLQQRCIGLTLFDEWQPKFLQIENMKHNFIEKNWSPFIKDNKLYFVYNYDPLIIIHYNLSTHSYLGFSAISASNVELLKYKKIQLRVYGTFFLEINITSHP